MVSVGAQGWRHIDGLSIGPSCPQCTQDTPRPWTWVSRSPVSHGVTNSKCGVTEISDTKTRECEESGHCHNKPLYSHNPGHVNEECQDVTAEMKRQALCEALLWAISPPCLSLECDSD